MEFLLFNILKNSFFLISQTDNFILMAFFFICEVNFEEILKFSSLANLKALNILIGSEIKEFFEEKFIVLFFKSLYPLQTSIKFFLILLKLFISTAKEFIVKSLLSKSC